MVIRGLFKITVLHLCLIFTISSCGVTDNENEQVRSEIGSTEVIQQSELLGYNKLEEGNKDSTNIEDDEIIFSGCPTCFEDPGDGTGGGSSCTPSNEYTISATYQNTTLSQGVSGFQASQISSHIRPYFGSLIQDVEEALETIEQDETSLWAQSPFHNYFIIDEKATFVTTLNSGAGLDFELNMYDFESKLYFANTGDILHKI